MFIPLNRHLVVVRLVVVLVAQLFVLVDGLESLLLRWGLVVEYRVILKALQWRRDEGGIR